MKGISHPSFVLDSSIHALGANGFTSRSKYSWMSSFHGTFSVSRSDESAIGLPFGSRLNSPRSSSSLSVSARAVSAAAGSATDAVFSRLLSSAAKGLRASQTRGAAHDSGSVSAARFSRTRRSASAACSSSFCTCLSCIAASRLSGVTE
ncbi:hypothetical protein ACFPRL_09945 [Pseudoclavibacter helvolus]